MVRKGILQSGIDWLNVPRPRGIALLAPYHSRLTLNFSGSTLYLRNPHVSCINPCRSQLRGTEPSGQDVASRDH